MDDESIMKIALLKAKYINSVPTQILSQMCLTLNLKCQCASMIAQLKKTISFILLIQRQNYKDYLLLPKFKRITHQTNQALNSYMDSLWSIFVQEREAIGDDGSFQQMHQVLFKNNMAKQIGDKNNAQLQMGTYSQENTPYFKFNQNRNFGLIGQGQMAFNNGFYQPLYINYSHPQFSTHSIYHPISNLNIQQNRSDSFFSKVADSNKNNNSFEKFEQDLQVQVKIEYQTKKEKKEKKIRQKQLENESRSLDQQASSKLNPYNIQNIEPFIIQLSFIHCLCAGRNVAQTDASFKCISCTSRFHLSCLRITKANLKECPFCIVTKRYTLTDLIMRPIKAGWESSKRNQKKTIFLEFDDIDRLNNAIILQEEKEKFHVQFRMIRICDSNGQSKAQVNSNFMLTLNQLKNIEKHKKLDIQLSNYDNDAVIYYYALVCVKWRNQESIISHVLSGRRQIGQQYWQNYLIKQKRSFINISIINPINRELIKIPVRGTNCTHLEACDLLSLLEFNNSRTIQCSVCNQPLSAIDSFVFDRFLYNILSQRAKQQKKKQIQGQPEHEIYDKNVYTILRYGIQGKVEWRKIDSEINEQSLNQEKNYNIFDENQKYQSSQINNVSESNQEEK